MKLHHIALAAQAQPLRIHGQATDGEHIAPPFPQAVLMGAAVQQSALHRAQVFRPLVLQVDEGPLAAAEGKVLDAGQREHTLPLLRRHFRMHVTPAGRCASSTVTS